MAKCLVNAVQYATIDRALYERTKAASNDAQVPTLCKDDLHVIYYITGWIISDLIAKETKKKTIGPGNRDCPYIRLLDSLHCWKLQGGRMVPDPNHPDIPDEATLQAVRAHTRLVRSCTLKG